MKLYVYPSVVNNEEHHYISILEPGIVSRIGLTVKSILGKLKDPHLGPLHDNVIYNPVFVTLLHKAIRESLAGAPEIIAEASRQVNGYIYIIDGRPKDSGNVQTKDIAGVFPVKDNAVIKEGYLPGPAYQLISDKGIFHLPDAVINALLTELTQNEEQSSFR